MSACLDCPRKCCGSLREPWLEPRFYPHEVEKGLHLKFNHRVWRIGGVELVTMDPEKPCPYYKDGLCLVYGTEDMPLDCMIYPAVPTVNGGIAIDYRGCPMARFFDNGDYKRKVLGLLKPYLPLDRRWLEAYWRVGNGEAWETR
jgi:Fe-S-cluster containining protein